MFPMFLSKNTINDMCVPYHRAYGKIWGKGRNGLLVIWISGIRYVQQEFPVTTVSVHLLYRDVAIYHLELRKYHWPPRAVQTLWLYNVTPNRTCINFQSKIKSSSGLNDRKYQGHQILQKSIIKKRKWFTNISKSMFFSVSGTFCYLGKLH